MDANYLIYGKKYPFLLRVKTANEIRHNPKCSCGKKHETINYNNDYHSDDIIENPNEIQGEIVFTLMPLYNSGYVVWSSLNDKGYNYSGEWCIRIIKKIKIARGGEKYETVAEFNLRKNYFRLNRAYLKDDYYLQISKPEESEITLRKVTPIIHDTKDIIGGGCNGAITDVWKCNGKEYAFEINKIECANGGSFYLSMGSTVESFDETNQVGIPFYAYVSSEVYNNYPWASSYPLGLQEHFYEAVPINVPINDNSYLDSDGNILHGLVYAIPKGLGQFNGTYFTAGPYTNPETFNSAIGTTLNFAIERFNSPYNTWHSQPANVNRPWSDYMDRPPLECIPYPELGGGGDYPHWGEEWWEWYLDEIDTWIEDVERKPKPTGDEFVGGNINDNIFNAIAKGDALYNGGSLNNKYPVTAIKQFEITRVDKKSKSIILNPENIYLKTGKINYPSVKLENGLYRFNVLFKGNSSFLSLVFEVNK